MGDESSEMALQNEKDGGRDDARVLCENSQNGEAYLEKDEVALSERNCCRKHVQSDALGVRGKLKCGTDDLDTRVRMEKNEVVEGYKSSERVDPGGH